MIGETLHTVGFTPPNIGAATRQEQHDTTSSRRITIIDLESELRAYQPITPQEYRASYVPNQLPRAITDIVIFTAHHTFPPRK